MEGTNVLASCVKQISRYSDEVDCFLDGSEQIYDKIVNGTKLISDFSKACLATTGGDGGERREKNRPRPAFQELHVKGFDCEQIWQGVEINNEQQIELLGTKINELLSNSDEELFLVKKDVSEMVETESIEDDDEQSILSDDIEARRGHKSKSKSSSGRTVMYKDFFDPPATDSKPKQKENISPDEDEISPDENDEEDSDEEIADSDNEKDDDFDDGENLEDDQESGADKGSQKANQFESKHEKQSKKIKEKIELLEKENLSQKPWQLIGEATAAKRPKNSLLEEHLTFDQTLVGAPTITEETTETLEDMIKQRVKDQAWDDVIRKVKPIEKPFEYKKSLGLDQEKSKLSLAEVYEKEYIKQTQEVKEDEKNPDHEVIQNMMDKLFSKLDALSNFQYTPKQPKPELKIITNLPSLQVEEFTPVTVSTEARLAPEEIYDKEKGEVKGQGEKTATDRKRERREKKAKKKEIIKIKEKKLKQGSKQSKKAALETVKKNKRSMKIAEAANESGKTLKSSTAFFNQLQENVGQQLTNEKNKQKKRKEINEKAERYKL
eukprot:Seg1713.4 transcript_id=Seg1713.4/GoldUCD/mRNA.D3Y31 product="U3 small nucleolar ribonucleoprotein MPP10" protein_id=Seg1713.4/GoldUCD/D3Y31